MKRLLLLVLLVGCTEPQDKPSAAGSWQGGVNPPPSAPPTASAQILTVTLTQDPSGNVAGTGTITNTSTGTRALTVTGAVAAGDPDYAISLTFSSGTSQPFNLSGVLSALLIAGTLNGSGFANDAIKLHRR